MAFESSDSNKNLTVILAQNYVGKTSFLRGIIWCLYDIVIPDDNGKEPTILNSQAKQEGNKNYSVELEIKHEERKYRVVRSFDSNFGPEFEIFGKNKKGKKTILKGQDAQEFIEEMSPKALSKYFFLRGENSSLDKSNSDLTNSVRTVLGLDDFDKANFHLKSIKKDISKKMEKLPKSDTALEIEVELKKTDDQIDSFKKKYQELNSEIDQKNQLIDELDSYAGTAQEIKLLNNKIQQMQNEIKSRESELESCKRDYYNWFRKDYKSTLLSEVASISFKYLDENKYKGNFPFAYAEQFISKLLEKEECICTRELKKETEFWDAVKEYASFGGDQRSYDLVVEINRVLRNGKNKKDETLEKFKLLESAITNKQDDIVRKEYKLKQLREKKETLASHDVLEKIQLAKEEKEKVKNLILEKGKIFQVLTDMIEKVKLLKKEYESSVQHVEELKELNEYLNYITKIEESIEEKKIELEKQARKNIEGQMQRIVNRYMPEKPHITISEKFLYQTGKGFYLAGGPKRLLDFAFTASILSFNQENNSLLTHTGFTLPLVIDSAFGETDEDFREALAKFLPELSEQVIVLASGVQAEKFVEVAEPYITEKYVIIRNLKSENDGTGRGLMNIDGKQIETRRYGQTKEESKIQRVKNAA